MIPVQKENYAIIDLMQNNINPKEQKYKKLLIEQLNWLNANYKQIKNKSFKLYRLCINNKLPNNIKLRCCNFKLLEKKCEEYNR